MADFTFPSLTTAVVGFASTVSFKVQSTSPYTQTITNGTISTGNGSGLNFGVISNTIPGWLTGRRPVSGQVFPRGVYNK